MPAGIYLVYHMLNSYDFWPFVAEDTKLDMPPARERERASEREREREEEAV